MNIVKKAATNPVVPPPQHRPINWGRILIWTFLLLLVLGTGVWKIQQMTPVIDPCPLKVQELLDNQAYLAENGRSSTPERAVRAYHESHCNLIEMRDAIVAEQMAGHDISGLVEEYLAELQHNDIFGRNQRLLGDWMIDHTPTIDSLRIWFKHQAQARAIEPVPLDWEACPPNQPGEQCWYVPEFQVGELSIQATLLEESSYLMVVARDYSVSFECGRLTPETGHLLWQCPITQMDYHLDGLVNYCEDIDGLWNATGHIIYWRFTDGAACQPPEPHLIAPQDGTPDDGAVPPLADLVSPDVAQPEAPAGPPIPPTLEPVGSRA